MARNVWPHGGEAKGHCCLASSQYYLQKGIILKLLLHFTPPLIVNTAAPSKAKAIAKVKAKGTAKATVNAQMMCGVCSRGFTKMCTHVHVHFDTCQYMYLHLHTHMYLHIRMYAYVLNVYTRVTI